MKDSFGGIMDTAILTTLIASATGAAGTVLGLLTQRYLTRKTIESNKNTQRLEVYKRVNKSLIDLSNSVNLKARNNKFILLGIENELENVPPQRILSLLVQWFHDEIGTDLYEQLRDEIDEALLLAGSETRVALVHVREMMEAEFAYREYGPSPETDWPVPKRWYDFGRCVAKFTTERKEIINSLMSGKKLDDKKYKEVVALFQPISERSNLIHRASMIAQMAMANELTH